MATAWLDSRNPSTRKPRIESRFRNLNILFFLLMSAIMVAVLALFTKNITEAASRDYARFYSLEAVAKFNTYLNRELGLVTKVAHSNALANWFADELSSNKKTAAFDEMMSYIDMLYSAELYFGINATLNEYSVSRGASFDEFKPFDVLSQTKEYDHWYFDCIYSKHNYMLNIDIDKVTNQRRLWINHKVVRDEKVLGVFCSGLLFEHVVKELFHDYDAASARGFVVDSKGVIQMDSTLTADDKLGEYEKERRIQEISADASLAAVMSGYFAAENYFSSGDRPQVIRLAEGQYSFAAVGPIPGTNWTVVTFYAESLFGMAKLWPLLYAMLGGLVIYTAIITLLSRKLIFTPFNRLIDSLGKVGIDTDANIYGSDADNEFGEISRTVHSMRARIERLAKERAEAEAANQAKSAFLARMSHEIRTPMHAILGITEMQMQDVRMPYRMMDAFGRIYTASYTLLGIINDLLDLSKIESGRMELLPAKYEIASLISDAVQLNLVRIGSKPIEFTLEVDEDMPSELFGDELRIRQILNNLLSNALKYTEKGEVVLSVSAENGGKDENRDVTLVCRVSDTGPGMTAEQVERLFDEYSRFDLEANRMIEGAGLGMSITRQLVHMMNGELIVESEPGRGSTFTALLPQGPGGVGSLGRELVESLRQLKVDMSHMQAPQIVREPMPYGNVLIVDDLETNLYVANGLMSPYGLTIDTALSGFEALDKIRSGKEYDIVFMDHMMPGMDGVEATKLLRELGYARPIIALTANAVAGQAEMFLNSGFNGFMSKPVDLRQLNVLLNRLIRDKQVPDVIEAARRQQGGQHTSDGASLPCVDTKLARFFIRDAEKATSTLEAICTNHYRRDNDIHLFVINVHAMKSALANIGESDLADLAYSLEQAGRKGDTDAMSAETPAFLKGLRAVMAKIAPKDEAGETTEEDHAYLREKLRAMQTACAAYDKKTVKDALAELQQKSWSRHIGEQLDAVAGYLLHSEFEEAAECCGRILFLAERSSHNEREG